MLVGMSTLKEVRDNLRALEIVYSELMADIDAIVEPVKDMLWHSGRPENDDF